MTEDGGRPLGRYVWSIRHVCWLARIYMGQGGLMRVLRWRRGRMMAVRSRHMLRRMVPRNGVVGSLSYHAMAAIGSHTLLVPWIHWVG